MFGLGQVFGEFREGFAIDGELEVVPSHDDEHAIPIAFVDSRAVTALSIFVTVGSSFSSWQFGSVPVSESKEDE